MKKYTAGLLICLAISIPAWFLGRLFPVVGGPVCAILIGMAIAPFIKGKERFRPGIAFTSKKILQYAVVLLGFGMNLSVVLEREGSLSPSSWPPSPHQFSSRFCSSGS